MGLNLEVVTTPFGRFQIDPQDLIGSTTKAGTLWDGPGFLQPIALEYGDLGTPGVTILDVGANIGTFTVWLAQHGAWRVLAVEPFPRTLQCLKANLDLNKAVTADRVIPIGIAAYDRPGTLTPYQVDDRNWGATAFRALTELDVVEIPAAPLDGFRWCFGDRVSLIKLDIQGCELRALLGLIDTIIRDHPTIVFEWEPELAKIHGDEWLGVEVFFRSQHYEIYPWPSQPNNYLARFRR